MQDFIFHHLFPITLLIIATTFLVLTLIAYYDFRFREPWYGYSFGFPLKGFKNTIFLTFDDGPSLYGKVLKSDDDQAPITDPEIRRLILSEIPHYDFDRTVTENLLDILDRHRVRAIFFILGEAMTRHPNADVVLKQMAAAGHIIGNHSQSHLYSTKTPFPEVLQDFSASHELIKRATGLDATLFRPPYGDWKASLSRQFLLHSPFRHYNFPLFWGAFFREWALRSKTELSDPDSRLTPFFDSCSEGDGKITLLHDTYIITVLLVSRLITECEKHGYSIGDPELLATASKRETVFFRNHPFLYHIRLLSNRILVRIARKQVQHANYQLDQ